MKYALPSLEVKQSGVIGRIQCQLSLQFAVQVGRSRFSLLLLLLTQGWIGQLLAQRQMTRLRLHHGHLPIVGQVSHGRPQLLLLLLLGRRHSRAKARMRGRNSEAEARGSSHVFDTLAFGDAFALSQQLLVGDGGPRPREGRLARLTSLPLEKA